jgi:hypothetical protein
VSKKLHAAGARRIAFDVSLVSQRLQKLGNGLRGLDLELLSDLAHARLIRVVAKKVEQIVIHPLLNRG